MFPCNKIDRVRFYKTEVIPVTILGLWRMDYNFCEFAVLEWNFSIAFLVGFVQRRRIDFLIIIVCLEIEFSRQAMRVASLML